jgi:hypothetical protein
MGERMTSHGRAAAVGPALLLSLAIGGCNPGPSGPTQSAPGHLTAASQFDPTTAGSVCGRVTWSGVIPVVPLLEVWSLVQNPDGSREKSLQPNPNVPYVDDRSRGVSNAIVFLRGVDVQKSKKWSHAPVLVEQRQRRFCIRQGELDSQFGFVRRGDPIEMISRDAVFHSLHADGAAFFTIPFPDPHAPCSRVLNREGIVELTSAAGHYAMRAYLFVDDHPYYARTDWQGRFELQQVPAGQYEVAGWMANWQKSSQERDPETAIVSRLFLAAPVEKRRTLIVTAGATSDIELQFSTSDFQR